MSRKGWYCLGVGVGIVFATLLLGFECDCENDEDQALEDD